MGQGFGSNLNVWRSNRPDRVYDDDDEEEIHGFGPIPMWVSGSVLLDSLLAFQAKSQERTQEEEIRKVTGNAILSIEKNIR